MTNERKIMIPGEVIVQGYQYLPGEGTEKQGDEIVALRFGIAEETNKLVKIIPISGVYQPRRGNVVIGKVENITLNGWMIDLNSAESSFLSIMEVPMYVNKNEMEEVMDIGELVVAKIWSINRRGIDLSIKQRGLGRIDEGIIVKVNPFKVPRIIGKEGSMISIIKEETGCEITVGQNGYIWIKGNKIEDELLAKKAVMFISDKSLIHGLTEEIKKWFEQEKK